MESNISVDQLSVGMFVSDLDRPWLDTPFLVQGFLIEDETTIHQLRQLCRHVRIDLNRSTIDGCNLAANRVNPPVRQVAVRAVAVPAEQSRRAQQQSWFSRLLRGISQSRAPVGQSSVVRSAAPSETRQGPGKPSSARVSRSNDYLRVSRVANQTNPATTPAQMQHTSVGTPGDVLTWLRANLGRISPSRSKSAEANDDAHEVAGDPRFKRSAPLLRVYQDSVPIEQELEHANESFVRATETIETVMHDIRVGKGLEIEAVESVVVDLVESIVRHPGALQLVSRMREADESAYTHALQVAVLMVSFGRELGFARAELQHLGQAGMLLDIGKMRIDQRILSKRGNLTPEEFGQMKQHVQYGLDIINSSSVAHLDVIQGVAQHHERLNGTGYPKNLKDDEIVPFGLMSGIVDAFSALTSVRPYAEPVSPYEAMQLLQRWGGAYFNAGLVEQFIQAIGIFPVGTLVELSTGEVAVVLEQNRARRLKPKVLVISAPDKTPLTIPATLDLLYGTGVAATTIPHIRRGLPTASLALDPKEYYLSRSGQPVGAV